MKDQRRNLYPTPEARVAMIIWGAEYSRQQGGSMDFWDRLTETRQRRCKMVVDQIGDTLTNELEASKKHSQDFFDVFHCIIDGAGHKNKFAIKWRNEEINILQAVQGYVDELKETIRSHGEPS